MFVSCPIAVIYTIPVSRRFVYAGQTGQIKGAENVINVRQVIWNFTRGIAVMPVIFYYTFFRVSLILVFHHGKRL